MYVCICMHTSDQAHSKHFVHVQTDIKPHNVLVDPETDVAKLCDMGSAKKLAEGTTSIAYICSRYVRALDTKNDHLCGVHTFVLCAFLAYLASYFGSLCTCILLSVLYVHV